MFLRSSVLGWKTDIIESRRICKAKAAPAIPVQGLDRKPVNNTILNMIIGTLLSPIVEAVSAGCQMVLARKVF